MRTILSQSLDMSLTPGTTLQNRKYVIQTVLHQSDFGVTYQAQHAYLERPVVLQTLNPSLRQRQDLAELRQQFLSKVRSLAQQLDQGRVLDCFEEDEMPYVVFELKPGQVPPQLLDWFPILPTVNSSAIEQALAQSPNQLANQSATAEVAVNVADSSTLTSKPSTAVEKTQPPAPVLVRAAIPSADTIAPESKTITPDPVGLDNLVALNPAAVNAANQPALPVTPSAAPSPIAPSPVTLTQLRRPKAWMPIALVSMCMLGGLVGAGMGLSLRLAPASQSQAEKQPKVPHRLLFNREQNFPAEANWPISETPLFTSDPTPIEEPVYRVSPEFEDYSQPPLQPLPETPIQQPALPLPSSQPTVKATTPSELETPLKPIVPPVAPPSRATTASPDLLPPINPVPAAPLEPAPPPVAAPELAPPAATELPIPEAAPPPLPDLPTQNPPVKQ